MADFCSGCSRKVWHERKVVRRKDGVTSYMVTCLKCGANSMRHESAYPSIKDVTLSTPKKNSYEDFGGVLCGTGTLSPE